MINCIIIDDEPLARKGISGFIRQIPSLHCIGQFAHAAEAAAVMQEVHLVFLDIEMPRINGVQFLQSLPHKPAVIITTAYPNYALESYEHAVIDYLVKPIPFERFVKAVNKAIDYIMLHQGDMTQTSDDYFFIKCESRYEKIRFDELLVVEALQNYVMLHTIGKRYITYLTMKVVEENLPQAIFLKVHKSFIVSRHKIESFDADKIHIGKLHIPLSRQHRNEIIQTLLADKFIKRKS